MTSKRPKWALSGRGLCQPGRGRSCVPRACRRATWRCSCKPTRTGRTRRGTPGSAPGGSSRRRTAWPSSPRRCACCGRCGCRACAILFQGGHGALDWHFVQGLAGRAVVGCVAGGRGTAGGKRGIGHAAKCGPTHVPRQASSADGASCSASLHSRPLQPHLRLSRPGARHRAAPQPRHS